MALDALPSRGRQAMQIASPPVVVPVPPPSADNNKSAANPNTNNNHNKCSHQFYIDADGIKRFKTDCL